jgi:uncharacterized membrane protein (UPF0182 family)
MSETLDGALNSVFGEGSAEQRMTATPGTPTEIPHSPVLQPSGVSALVREAQQHYDRAITAQRKGDWATYGAELQQLGELLKRMDTH